MAKLQIKHCFGCLPLQSYSLRDTSLVIVTHERSFGKIWSYLELDSQTSQHAAYTFETSIDRPLSIYTQTRESFTKGMQAIFGVDPRVSKAECSLGRHITQGLSAWASVWCYANCEHRGVPLAMWFKCNLNTCTDRDTGVPVHERGRECRIIQTAIVFCPSSILEKQSVLTFAFSLTAHDPFACSTEG